MRKLMILIMIVTSIMTMAGRIGAADTRFRCEVHRGEWVWIRETPSKDGTKIDTMRYGVEGEIHEIVNGYARITADNGKQGWVDVSWLLMPIKETIYIKTCSGPLNKRETPDGRYLGRIKGDETRISVLGWRYSPSGELWAHVYHGGYVKAQFLTKAEAD